MICVDLIAGTRPNFVKVAAVIHALEERARKGGEISYRLIHTGQHYDYAMSGSFFDQLSIPEPEINFGVGSRSQAQQTAQIMVEYERLLLSAPAAATVVFGDVNSTMACSLAAAKLNIPVAHVEAGIRSHDRTMPEEINRIVTDSVSSWFYTTTRSAYRRLIRQGAQRDRVFFVGNTMIDTLIREKSRFTAPEFWSAFGLEERGYLVLTLHRPSNVDDAANLDAILEIISSTAQGLKIIFPAHPRLRATLSDTLGRYPNFKFVEPLGYLEFNYLVTHARGVITDSGGITEETTVLGVPCITLRDNTERPETVKLGTNMLVGSDPRNLVPAMERLLRGRWKRGRIPERWDGFAGARIVDTFDRLLGRS